MTDPSPSDPLARLVDSKSAWLEVPLEKRRAYLAECRQRVMGLAKEWVAGGAALKGIAPRDPLEGEEWIAGPMATVRTLRLLEETVVGLERGKPPRPIRVTRDGDRFVVQVFPASRKDRVLFAGFSAEVWIEPGKPPSQGAVYRNAKGPEGRGAGRVALVLGGGNVTSIPPLDVLYKLFVEDQVVLLKMNPVNAFLARTLRAAFEPLVADGFLAIVEGDSAAGAALADDPRVDTLHLTGSHRTYDAIVWGEGDEGARRKASGARRNDKPFTAELGCVTPVVVVPGPWSLADMKFQAAQVAAMVTQNASFNCNAAKVLVVDAAWAAKQTFLGLVDEALAKARPRKAYYPGAFERYRSFVAQYPRAKALSPAVDDSGAPTVPWTMIPEVPAAPGEYALQNEAFCGVLAVVSLTTRGQPAGGRHADIEESPERAFMREATAFVNDACWGTLSASVLIHPSTAEAERDAYAQMIRDLRYGAIGINCWPAVAYGLGVTTWGAFPGHTPEDIRSGVGVVHNAWLFDHPEKSVVYAPFRIRPKPVWFSDHRTLAKVGELLTAYEDAPSWGKVFSIARAAIRG